MAQHLLLFLALTSGARASSPDETALSSFADWRRLTGTGFVEETCDGINLHRFPDLESCCRDVENHGELTAYLETLDTRTVMKPLCEAKGFFNASLPALAPAPPAVTCVTPWTKLGDDIDGTDPDARSGFEVAMNAAGTRIAIAAYSHSGVNGFNSGLVRVYDWDGTAWGQVGSAIIGAASGDASGRAISMSADGSRLAIGGPYADTVNGVESGHVRVYDWDGTAWGQVGSDINGEAAEDHSGFGLALSADGSRIAIGAIENDGNGDGAGQVRVYDWNGAAWVKVGSDINGTPGVVVTTGERLGIDIAISADGSRIVAGAWISSGSSNVHRVGVVRTYDWDGTAWGELGNGIEGEAAGDYSGETVALSADGLRIAIGSRWNDGNGVGIRAGHVRVYDWNGAAWAKLGNDIDGEAAEDRAYRVSMSADGSRIAVGAHLNDGVNGPDSGHVRVFDWDGSAWVQVGSNIDGEAQGDKFGFGLAMSADGSRFAAGGEGNDAGGNGAGHVRVYACA